MPLNKPTKPTPRDHFVAGILEYDKEKRDVTCRIRKLIMQSLEWKAFLRDPAVEAAYQDLKYMSSRNISLHSRSLVPGIPGCFWRASRSAKNLLENERGQRIIQAVRDCDMKLVSDIVNSRSEEDIVEYLRRHGLR